MGPAIVSSDLSGHFMAKCVEIWKFDTADDAARPDHLSDMNTAGDSGPEDLLPIVKKIHIEVNGIWRPYDPLYVIRIQVST